MIGKWCILKTTSMIDRVRRQSVTSLAVLGKLWIDNWFLILLYDVKLNTNKVIMPQKVKKKTKQNKNSVIIAIWESIIWKLEHLCFTVSVFMFLVGPNYMPIYIYMYFSAIPTHQQPQNANASWSTTRNLVGRYDSLLADDAFTQPARTSHSGVLTLRLGEYGARSNQHTSRCTVKPVKQ
jgi:hypothetical protein